MFERKSATNQSENHPAQIRQLSAQGEPVEFVYQGVRFHVNQILSHWLQTNNWWQDLDKKLTSDFTNDDLSEQVIKFWQVEAAPIGAITTFEIQFNQSNNTWQIQPSSRANSRNKK
jgi:hypothetical protein